MFTWPKLVKKPRAKNVLILAPHIDDEIIGCGGVICKHVQNGDRVIVVYFTCGDKGNKDFSRDENLAKIRRAEAEISNNILGVKQAYFFDFEDGTKEDWSCVKDEMKEIYLKVCPDLVYLPPYYDLHLDHRKTNWLFQEATESIDVCDLCVYEVWTPINPNIIINITEEMEQKIRAIRACQTQVDSVDYEAFIKNLNAYRSSFALSSFVKYAECFYMLSAKEYFSKFTKREFDWHTANRK